MTEYKNFDEYRGFDHGLSYVTGISDLNPWTLRYMMRPHSHTGRTFWCFYNETIEMIKAFLHTKGTLVPFPGPGRVAMDAALNNFLEPGEKMVMVDNGYWGRYPEVMAETYGIQLIPLVFPSSRPIDPKVLEDRLREVPRDVKAVHIMHVETECGIINPVKRIGEIVHRNLPNALYMVDSATAFPGNKIELDNWGIDVDYFVSHKGFNGPSGLTFLAVNDRAMEAFRRRSTLPRSWYTSIQTWMDSWLENKDDGRHCQESFPNVILYAMRAKLDLMNQMGEGKYLKKYALASKAIREGLRHMTEVPAALMVLGPKCAGCPGCDAPDPNLTADGRGRFCAQTDVAISYPPGMDWKKNIEILEERYWITCPHFGFGDGRKEGLFYGPNGMRVGIVNDRQHFPHNILALITALGFSLKECGIPDITRDKALEATNAVLRQMQQELGWGYYEK